MSTRFSAHLRTKLKDLESSIIASHESLLHDVSTEVTARLDTVSQSKLPGSLTGDEEECQCQKSILRAVVADAIRTVDDKAFPSQEPDSPKTLKSLKDLGPLPPALTGAAATPAEPPPAMPIDMLPAVKQSVGSAPASRRGTVHISEVPCYFELGSDSKPQSAFLSSARSSPMTSPRCSNINFDDDRPQFYRASSTEEGDDDIHDVSRICRSTSNLNVPRYSLSSGFYMKQETGKWSTRSSVASRKSKRADSDEDEDDDIASHVTMSTGLGIPRTTSMGSKKGVHSLQGGHSRFLNSNHEAELDVLPIWQDSRELLQSLKDGECRIENPLRRTVTVDTVTDSIVGLGQENKMKCSIARFVVMPNSSKRISWDLLGLVFITYDAVFIPLAFFDPPEMTTVTVMNWAARLFWTCDLPTSFVTGFLTADGQVEMRPASIFWHYARTWLIPDLLVIWFDWMEVFVSFGNAASVGQTSRSIRLVRLLRMLRLAKLPELLASMGERIRSEELILVVNMLKVTCFILGLAHLIACIWYGIGSKDDTDSSWVWHYGYSDRTMFDQYMMSFHWSLVTYTGGTQDVRSRNNVERTFEVIVAFLCFVASASFVSSLTSSLTRLQIISGSKSAQFIALRKYLSNRGISRRLMVRVQRNAQHVFLEKQRNVPEAEVDLLHIISEPLRVELHYEEYSPIYKQHPFFTWYANKNPAGMRKICHLATSHKTLSSGDILFTNGEIPADPQMCIVLAGSMEYLVGDGHQSLGPKHSRGTKASNEYEKEYALPGRSISEVVLWIPWVHRGNLRASAECRLICSSARIFHDIADQFASAECHPGLYAIEFCDSLKADKELGILPNDLLRPEMPYEVMGRVLCHTQVGRVSRISTGSNALTLFRPLFTRAGTLTELGSSVNFISMAKTSVRRLTSTATLIGQHAINLSRQKTLEAANAELQQGPRWSTESRETSSFPVSGSVVPKESLKRSSTAG